MFLLPKSQFCKWVNLNKTWFIFQMLVIKCRTPGGSSARSHLCCLTASEWLIWTWSFCISVWMQGWMINLTCFWGSGGESVQWGEPLRECKRAGGGRARVRLQWKWQRVYCFAPGSRQRCVDWVSVHSGSLFLPNLSGAAWEGFRLRNARLCLTKSKVTQTLSGCSEFHEAD